ncbi:MAG: porin [Pseudomonadota bacterium]
MDTFYFRKTNSGTLLSCMLPLLMFTSPARAQQATSSSVVLYGLVDAGFDSTSNVAGVRQSRIQSGQWTGSNWGIRVTEDLGGGMAALANLEAGVNLDTGESTVPATLFDRRAIVGFRSASLGTLTLGRQPDLIEWLNPLTTNRLAGNIALGVHGLAASGQSNRVNVVRMSNSLRYESAPWHGLSAGAYVALSEDARQPANGRSEGLGARYVQGPWQAVAVWYRFKGDDAQWNGSNRPVAAASGGLIRTDRVAGAGLSYETARFRLSGIYTDESNHLFVNSPRTRVLDLNLTLPMAAWTFGAGLQTQSVKWANAQPNDSYRQLSLAVTYAMSRRTNLYAHLARQVTSAGDKARLGATAGASSNERQSGVRLGIRHTF